MSQGKANRKERRERKGRYCLRCGCTEERACPGGCSWVADSNVCSVCLSPGESEVLAELSRAWYESKTERDEDRVQNRIKTFGRYLNEDSADWPIPFVPVKNLAASNKRAATK